MLAGLDQAHAAAAVFAQSRGEHAARASGADDDRVEALGAHARFLRCSSRSRSSRRRIFPLIVFGRSVTNSISRGYLYGAVTFFTCSCSSAASASLALCPGASTTNAFTIAPRTGSGLATAAA